MSVIMVKLNPEYEEDMNNVENINNNLRLISIEDYDMNEYYEFDANLSLEENIARKFVLKKLEMVSVTLSNCFVNSYLITRCLYG